MQRLRRSLAYLVIAGSAMVVAAIVYLGQSGPLSGTLVFTVTAGVFVSVVLGGGLMALGFYSAQSGVDEASAGATPEIDPAESADARVP
jgi:hypothetical protein